MDFGPNSTKGKVFIWITGMLNIVSGITSLLLALSMNIFALVAGILYFIFSSNVFAKSTKLKKLFYFVIIPLTGINLYFVADMYSRFGSEPPYGIDFSGFIIFVIIPVVTVLANIVYLRIVKHYATEILK